METEPAGRGTRELTFTSGGDRLILKVVFVVAVAGFTVELSRPSVASWRSDTGFVLFMTVACWLAFRAGFRTRLVAHAGSFEVVNLLSTHQVPYAEIDSLVLDWLSIRLTCASGRRIRVWGLPESFLSARGDKAQKLVRRLGDIVEQRGHAAGPADGYRRTVFADWWVLLAILAVFSAAVAFRTVRG